MEQQGQSAASSASAPPPVTSGEMTAGEKLYFDSRGADTSGLDSESSGQGEQQGGTGSAEQSLGNARPEEFNPDDVTVGEDGKARNSKGQFVTSVPHAVFHKKNEQLKTTRAELERQIERFTRADERLRIMNEAVSDQPAGKANGKAKTALEESDIDPESDIFGAFRQSQRRLKEIQEASTKTASMTEARLSEHDSHTKFKEDAANFVRTTPDFGDAFDHLVAARHSELQLLGMSDQAERDAAISKEGALMQEWQRGGKSPSANFYALAKLRGYQPKAAAQAVDPAKGPAAQGIERTNAGQAASLSLKGAGGAPATEAITLAKLADMSDAEFSATQAAFVAKNGKPAWEKLLRGA